MGCQNGSMAERSYPFRPRTARQLQRGDIIGVPCEPEGWVCLQVVDLASTGPGSLRAFVAGALPWRGEAPPTSAAVAGLGAVEQGLTRIELFSEGNAQVFCNVPVKEVGLTSVFRDHAVGTTHHVWGWQTAIRKSLVNNGFGVRRGRGRGVRRRVVLTMEGAFE